MSKFPANYAKCEHFVRVVRETDLGQTEITRRTGVSFEGFRFYLNTWHKELVLERRKKLK